MLRSDYTHPYDKEHGWLKNKYVEITYMDKTYIGVIEACYTYDFGVTTECNDNNYAHGFSMYIVENEKLKKICLEIPANKFKITFLPKNDEIIFRLKYDL